MHHFHRYNYFFLVAEVAAKCHQQAFEINWRLLRRCYSVACKENKNKTGYLNVTVWTDRGKIDGDRLQYVKNSFWLCISSNQWSWCWQLVSLWECVLVVFLRVGTKGRGESEKSKSDREREQRGSGRERLIKSLQRFISISLGWFLLRLQSAAKYGRSNHGISICLKEGHC